MRLSVAWCSDLDQLPAAHSGVPRAGSRGLRWLRTAGDEKAGGAEGRTGTAAVCRRHGRDRARAVALHFQTMGRGLCNAFAKTELNPLQASEFVATWPNAFQAVSGAATSSGRTPPCSTTSIGTR